MGTAIPENMSRIGAVWRFTELEIHPNPGFRLYLLSLHRWKWSPPELKIAQKHSKNCWVALKRSESIELVGTAIPENMSRIGAVWRLTRLAAIKFLIALNSAKSIIVFLDFFAVMRSVGVCPKCTFFQITLKQKTLKSGNGLLQNSSHFEQLLCQIVVKKGVTRN